MDIVQDAPPRWAILKASRTALTTSFICSPPSAPPQWLLDRAKKQAIEEMVHFNPDPFLQDFQYTWDFILVFNVFGEDEKLNPVQRDNTLKKTLRRLSK